MTTDDLSSTAPAWVQEELQVAPASPQTLEVWVMFQQKCQNFKPVMRKYMS